jgi:adenylate kinase
MGSQAYIFIGRSGCGKGTQAAVLQAELLKQGRRVLYVETGDIFREFIKGEGYSNRKSNELYQTAVRQPDFLACYMWTEVLINSFEEGMDVIFDGTPRSLSEAKVLESSLAFYGFEKTSVIHLEVSREWSEKHLLARGRSDDVNMEKISRRLDWYELDVVPAIDYFKSNQKLTYKAVHGEVPVEAVSQSVREALSV